MIDGMKVNPWETYSYQASKAAVIHLTRKMASKLVQENIIMTGIAPGAFASTMNKAARDHGDAVAPGIPAKRIGRPEDMAGAAVFLASAAGDYVIGTTLAVDGGVVNAANPNASNNIRVPLILSTCIKKDDGKTGEDEGFEIGIPIPSHANCLTHRAV